MFGNLVTLHPFLQNLQKAWYNFVASIIMQKDIFKIPIEHKGETKIAEVRAVDSNPVDYEIWVDNRHWFTLNASHEQVDPITWKIKGDNYTGIDEELVQKIGSEIERHEM